LITCIVLRRRTSRYRKILWQEFWHTGSRPVRSARAPELFPMPARVAPWVPMLLMAPQWAELALLCAASALSASES
jgi:hypothetical protein